MPERYDVEFRLSPSVSCPERVAVVLGGRVLGHACGERHAGFWAQGYVARLRQESRRGGPVGDAQARTTWCRGWDRANAHELPRERREKRGDSVTGPGEASETGP